MKCTYMTEETCWIEHKCMQRILIELTKPNPQNFKPSNKRRYNYKK